MTLSLKTILLAVLATKTVSSPLKDLMERGQGGGYCAFYTEDACENRSGGTDYSVDNDGIIQNGGKYLSCGTGEFALISYPPGDSAGDNPNHCVTFPGQSSSDPCNDLTELGFTPGDAPERCSGSQFSSRDNGSCSALNSTSEKYTNQVTGGYYRFTTEFPCPAVSKTKRASNETLAFEFPKRDANYLTFDDDPDCTQRSGGVDYSTHNDGCFKNGGAYIDFGGDDFDWSLQEFADDQCGGTPTNCMHGDKFGIVPDVVPCYHLDDFGYTSGTGSWKITRGGCP